MTALAPDLSKRIAESADVVTVALDELLPRADGPESRLTEAMRYAALGPGLKVGIAWRGGGVRSRVSQPSRAPTVPPL